MAVTAKGWPFASRHPTLEEQRLVRLCLCRDDGEAAQIWEDLTPLRRRIASHSQLRSPLRRLLPLLRYALKARGVALEDRLEATLRAATLWETHRMRRIEQIIADVLDALQSLSATPVLLKGVSLAWRDYPEPWLRHCHDLDLLLPADAHEAAQTLLLGAGARLEGRGQAASRVLRWPGGLPILLHSRLTSGGEGGESETLARSRATAAMVAGRSVLLLHPSDCVAQLAAQLAEGVARDGLCWVPDLVMLLRSSDSAVPIDAAGSTQVRSLNSMIRFVEEDLGITVLQGGPG